ncbi:hypothetical protein C9415_10420 [Kluyvera sp. Nf5]|nr:hypothetical protein C9415_10420 [Kluyvera sp. Nf5]
MYIYISVVIMLLISFFIIKVLHSTFISHSIALNNKKMLIIEAEKVISSMDNLSWEDMTTKQRELHECAVERLRLLKSYKMNHAPDNYPFIRQWPSWFNQQENE